MRDFASKTAFVTGGASGIGLALGRTFAEAGMKVMLADIETNALAAAVKSLHNLGPDVRGVTCHVVVSDSVESAAKAASALSCRTSAPMAKAATSSTPPPWQG